MIQVGQYYFGDSGVKWVSFQLVLTPAYPRCYLRAPIVGAWPGLPEAVRNVDAEVRRGGRPMNADLIRFSIALDVVVPGTYQPDVCPSGAVTAVTASGEGAACRSVIIPAVAA
ncbi:hypothetical protein YDC107_5283 (plasmid) [Escherichia coli]|uniref:Uncharacterized protein n=5 Tax=Gammaproteobacteria TaxID=1236 RepID=A0A649Z3L3_PSEAI|nr:hypothetical protein CFNIH1_25800 [Citrobacter freundii CFNIH1]AID93499.1 hypothetical protein KONIH1_31715 [Klebsiella oxytoca KONIH1]AIE66476.1 hypothetical protein ECNIH2_24695 [Enterobacter cloacae ECNIH2]AOO34799.1 hypothetical protein [Klebsiella pneumoniae]AUO37400.1 hypothetical protein YDC107_5283 [Escherichia coli]KEF64546.1 hypothetical protein Y972_27370 [Klebsiella pneumoniae UHKPC45]QGM49713.1 hypothetical protein [Pseudomonas aeruginosa]QZG78626.1 hypothetical protein Km242